MNDTSPRQGDLFGHEGPDPADENFETPVYEADPEEVRQELNGLLAQMRAAETMPWDAKRTALYRTIVPQIGELAAGRRSQATLLRVRDRAETAGSRVTSGGVASEPPVELLPAIPRKRKRRP